MSLPTRNQILWQQGFLLSLLSYYLAWQVISPKYLLTELTYEMCEFEKRSTSFRHSHFVPALTVDYIIVIGGASLLHLESIPGRHGEWLSRSPGYGGVPSIKIIPLPVGYKLLSQTMKVFELCFQEEKQICNQSDSILPAATELPKDKQMPLVDSNSELHSQHQLLTYWVNPMSLSSVAAEVVVLSVIKGVWTWSMLEEELRSLARPLS